MINCKRERRFTGLKDLKTLVKLAHYYYRDGLTQEQIAEKMVMSRQKINRMLKRVLNEGVVKIEIIDYMSQNIEIERELETVFGLKNAIVLLEPDDEKLLEKLGYAAAQYLMTHLRHDMVIGVSWGRTLSAVAKNVKGKYKGISIVQMAGGATHNNTTLADETVVKFSQNLNGTPFFLHAPVFVDNKETKVAMMEEQYLKNRFSMIEKCDIAVLGIGGLGKGIIPFRDGYVEDEVLEELQRKGAVGHISFRYFDKNGNRVYSSLDERIIVPTCEQLKKISLIIGVAGGKEKEKGVLGVVKGKMVDVLVTSIGTAKYLLENK